MKSSSGVVSGVVRRSLVAATAAGLIGAVSVVQGPAWTTPSPKMEKAGSLDFSFRRKERCVMRRINSIRQNHGRSALQRDGHLGYVARLHAVKIANVLGLFHDDAFGTKVTNWERLGQNTGRGRTCRSVVRAFMSDQVHKDIILGPWRHQGVGISRGADGRIYVQHIFEARRDPGNVFGVG